MVLVSLHCSDARSQKETTCHLPKLRPRHPKTQKNTQASSAVSRQDPCTCAPLSGVPQTGPGVGDDEAWEERRGREGAAEPKHSCRSLQKANVTHCQVSRGLPTPHPLLSSCWRMLSDILMHEHTHARPFNVFSKMRLRPEDEQRCAAMTRILHGH